MAQKPVIHGRDHAVGGADPVQKVDSLDGGGGPLTGDVTLSAGTGIDLTQAGQNIEIAATAATFAGCRLLGPEATQTFPDGATAIQFDVEQFDTDGFHSTVSNIDQVVIPADFAGKYWIGGRTVESYFTAGETTTGLRNLAIVVNGFGIEPRDNWESYLGRASATAVNREFICLGVSHLLHLDDGDIIQLYFYQEQSPPANIPAGILQVASLELSRLGP